MSGARLGIAGTGAWHRPTLRPGQTWCAGAMFREEWLPMMRRHGFAAVVSLAGPVPLEDFRAGTLHDWPMTFDSGRPALVDASIDGQHAAVRQFLGVFVLVRAYATTAPWAGEGSGSHDRAPFRRLAVGRLP